MTPNSGVGWRLKFRAHGKESLLAFGRWPNVSLKEARERRDEAKKLIQSGISPAARKKAEKAARARRAADSFESIAREWLEQQIPRWAPGNARKTVRSFEKDLFPWIGDRPIADIDPPELLAVLRRVQSRGALNTSHRVQRVAGCVFRYAVSTGKAKRDPSMDLRGALPPAKGKNLAAITEPRKLGELLRAIDTYVGQPTTLAALRLIPHVFTRPSELRAAEWAEFDLKTPSRSGGSPPSA